MKIANPLQYISAQVVVLILPEQEQSNNRDQKEGKMIAVVFIFYLHPSLVLTFYGHMYIVLRLENSNGAQLLVKFSAPQAMIKCYVTEL